MDPHNKKALASRRALDYWSSVDWYNGGMEHTTLHLPYSRFWHRSLYDIGVVPIEEFYKKYTSYGVILGEGGGRMFKSRGNVINPNSVMTQYSTGTMWLYIMFIGSLKKAAAWNDNAVKGYKRFLNQVQSLTEDLTEETGCSETNEGMVHKTIEKVFGGIEAMKFNATIAVLVALVNGFYRNNCSEGGYAALLFTFSPSAPHAVEELWETLGFAAEKDSMAHQQSWPAYDASKTVDVEVNMAVQVCNKLHGTTTVPADNREETVVATVLADPKMQKFTEDKKLVKTVLIPNKLISLIAK